MVLISWFEPTFMLTVMGTNNKEQRGVRCLFQHFLSEAYGVHQACAKNCCEDSMR